MARRLRRDSTEAERKLWSALRDRQLFRFKFRRQQPIGSFIVDFVCQEKRLVIELDGGQHADKDETSRTGRIEADGYKIIRFWNHEVLGNLDGVLARIQQALLK
ncbi:MAG TPA: endonuclease domain-containing protein [Candidatus Cybelea sp.]|nr:endonuclease domain-containing protein [Candidatus Cybelea sp.]